MVMRRAGRDNQGSIQEGQWSEFIRRVDTSRDRPSTRLAPEMEEEVDKSVIAINTATVWHAYRTNGIKDQIQGFGSLLAEQ